MTTPSPKLGLALPAKSDLFSTDDIKANWEKIDAAPGAYICTSSTTPKWGAAETGRKIIETNTGLEWLWDGTKMVRLGGIGLLKCSNGSFAVGERPTPFSTTSKTYVKAVSVTSVVVPAGNRPIRVDVSWPSASNAKGTFYGAIFRSNTNNSGPLQGNWNFGTTGADDEAGGGTFFTIERAGLAAGTYDFSLQIHCGGAGGTSMLNGGTISPVSIFVSEM